MLPRLTLNRFSLLLQPQTPLYLPGYKGSTLRGGFGYAFKKVTCADPNPCKDCRLPEKCVYAYVFETPPPAAADVMRKYKAAPHPFVILPPLTPKRRYAVGDELGFDLTLFGRALDYLPYFIYSFEELGRAGIGQGRGRFHLKEATVHDGNGGQERVYDGDKKVLKTARATLTSDQFLDPVSSRDSTLTLHFLTPLRLISDGQLAKEIPFQLLFRNLIRRIALLSYFHCDGDPSKIDFRELIQKAESVKTVKSRLEWYDWERYSTRQQTRMSLGGWLGEITYQGDFSEFLPWIRLGEWTHVGKGTSFGLGRYRFDLAMERPCHDPR
ncbi:MAG TPA: CRISPR system precrRNA processing endoribonuclease RAMP protein Cas6 [Candidatus Acidoferrales bacterium]|nr:CRISPR system precrRNA processing endoribonuclease RAMP protein Cas6 [Candidatus Acidoferrales bacterium]